MISSSAYGAFWLTFFSFIRLLWALFKLSLKCSPDTAVAFEVKETILAATLRIGYQVQWYLKRKISYQNQFRLSQTIKSFAVSHIIQGPLFIHSKICKKLHQKAYFSQASS